MGTLIKMKAEVMNPELPVLTEQGILPYYTGVYVNRLAEKGVTLTQAEVNAVTAFINSLIEADLIDKIGTFYPFMGNVNVPLIGSKELEFANVTSTNTKLDFVGDKLRGVNGFENMGNVKLSDLANADFGVMFGGSMISKIPTATPSNPAQNIFGIKKDVNTAIPSVQLRINKSAYSYNFVMYDFYDPNDDSHVTTFRYNPALDTSDSQHNYSFTHGLTNVAPPYSTGTLEYNRTLKRDGVLLANAASNDETTYIQTENLGNLIVSGTSGNAAFGFVLTTLAIFNEILDKNSSKAFVDALDTFAAAVGKTVSVG